jgi:hypothetical protein
VFVDQGTGGGRHHSLGYLGQDGYIHLFWALSRYSGPIISVRSFFSSRFLQLSDLRQSSMISACDPHHSIRPGSYSSSVKQSSSRCTTVRPRIPFPSFERRILVVGVSLASLASIRNTSTTSEPCRNHQCHPSLILWSPILAHQMPSTKPRDPHIPSALYHEYQRSPNIMPAYSVAHAIHLRRPITQAYSRISSLPAPCIPTSPTSLSVFTVFIETLVVPLPSFSRGIHSNTPHSS